MTGESREVREKRMRMRSMRRGIKEMDLLLVAYCDARMSGMDDDTLDLYDRLLHENDQDLYAWVTGRVPAPDQYAAMVGEISRAISEA